MTNIVYGYGHGRAGGRRATGLIGVAVFHAALIYALITGLAQDVVKNIPQKVEVSIFSEPPPTPPPPPKVQKIIPKMAPPPPQPKAYVPPVEHPQPVPARAAIVATTSEPVPQTPVPAPAQPAPTPAPSGPVSAKGNCSHIQAPVYPDKALDDGIGGAVDVTFATGPEGKLTGAPELIFKGVPASYQKYFRTAVLNALQAYACNPDLQLKQHIAFNLSDS